MGEGVQMPSAPPITAIREPLALISSCTASSSACLARPPCYLEPHPSLASAKGLYMYSTLTAKYEADSTLEWSEPTG